MTTTIHPPTIQPTPHHATPHDSTQHERELTPKRGLDDRRLAGIGGITFAITVLITNILQGATPAFDAPPSEVIEYLTDRRGQSIFAVAAFAFGALPLMMFASAFYSRLRATAHPADLVWARFGMIGALLILPVFALVVVQRLVLLAGIDEIIGSPELVAFAWRMEMAAFLINTLPISAAVLGFGIAGSRAGLLPRWYRYWAPIGATAGVVTAMTALAGLEGNPVGFLGIVPFLSWMTLLLVGGVRQLRSARS
jgi:hypothetical protein